MLLGISLAALPSICAELPEASPRWTAMCEGIGTVATQAVQLWMRANLNPSNRYVQALAGTTKLRLRADESGFEGLTITGTWTRNNYTLSCIEAAAMAGRQAARAISGVPMRIPGEEDV